MPDRQNERMVIDSCFDQETIDYHMKEGYIDYDHVSFRGKTDREKSEAILGKPKDFYWLRTELGNQPIVEGDLFIGNPYVDNVLIPSFEGGNKVFGVSVGGKVLEKSNKKEKDPITGKLVTNIYKILWVHDAITPLYKAVNSNTTIEKIVKSLESICETAIIKSDFNKNIIQSFTDLQKSLMANEGVTNYATLNSGGALQPQSLEGDGQRYRQMVLNSAIIDIKSERLKRNFDEIYQYLLERKFENLQAQEFARAIFEMYFDILNIKI